jgi:mannose-6-phosphate isomerase-like protein (cupin superfamily)
MSTDRAAPAVRRPEQIPASSLGPGVTATEMLDDRHGCRGLHQRRLRFAGGTGIAGTAGGQGEAWYVISGSGRLDAERPGSVALEPGTAVWLEPALGYACQARPGQDLEILAVTVRAGSGAPGATGALGATGAPGPSRRVVRLADCEPERTGDREFRVLLSEGLTITQFAGLIPPGRAPAHHHTYDEVVHVLAGRGVVHLSGTMAEIGPGTSIYLPPYQPHCLENTGPDPLEVLGVFHPAGSPAAKQAS